MCTMPVSSQEAHHSLIGLQSHHLAMTVQPSFPMWCAVYLKQSRSSLFTNQPHTDMKQQEMLDVLLFLFLVVMVSSSGLTV